MNCIVCKQGELRAGKVTVTLQRDNTVVVIKETPADVCENCGAYSLSDSVAENVLRNAKQAAEKGVEVEISRYAA